jgi:F420-non-reducing hydrogenase iron-sulfur subunit
VRTRKRVAYVQRILKEIGIEPERVQMFNLSSAMAPRFAEIADQMTAQARDLGPSPLQGT